MELVVTTVRDPSGYIENKAAELSAALDAPLIPRHRKALATIKEEQQCNYIVIAAKDGPLVHTPGGEYYFHLNMAELRINNLINGKTDHMIAAMDLNKGMSVLDCTLGLATDAIVAGFVIGDKGKICGMEASRIIATVTGLGLGCYQTGNDAINDAMRRINVIHADYYKYLPEVPAQSYDVVYFDPMFRVPVTSSSSLKPIRYLADDRPVDSKAINEALRIAKRRVVIKEANGSTEFSRLGFSTILGGKYSSVQYGVIEAGE